MILFFLLIPLGESAPERMKISSDLQEKIVHSASEEKIPVIIMGKADSSDIEKEGGTMKHKFSIIQGVAASVPAGKINALSKNPNIERIVLDHKVQALRLNSVPLIRADTAASTFLVNGTGINISIIDTGVFNHTEFQNPNRIIAQKCYCTGNCCPDGTPGSNNATDDYGHGTHVAGIAAGKGYPGSLTSGLGVATNASILAVKVLDSSGSGDESDVISGIGWAVDNGAHILSLSLGINYSTLTDCYDSVLSSAVDNATAQGKVVVVAAGNDGPSQSISAPACAKRAITVGAVNKNDLITSYSSRGPTNDNRTKPDLAAIGGELDSVCGAGKNWIVSTYNSTDGYACAYGTSQAAPHVTGVAALLLQKYNQGYGYLPSPYLVKAILLTAVNTTKMNSAGYTQRNNVYGAGRIDAYVALNIMNYTKNSSISTGQLHRYQANIGSNSAVVTLYWPDSNATKNNLDLIVGNTSQNFSYGTDVNDTIEQVFLYNISAGAWNVYVNGTNVTGSINYYLAATGNLANDTVTPLVENATRIHPAEIRYNNSINLSVDVLEDFYLDKVWVQLGKPSGYMNVTITNTSTTTFNLSSYSYSYEAGSWNATFWANDSWGHINKSSLLSWAVWGWSKVNRSYLTSSTVDANQTNRNVTMGCLIQDVNATSYVTSYNVSFFRDDSFLGWNITNSTGWSLFRFDNNVAQGNYTIKCNITDNSSLYYNATADNWQNLTLEVKDLPPTIVIDSPLNQSYSSGSRDYNITVTKVLNWSNVSIDGGTNATMTNDTVYHYYNLSSSHPSLSEGRHNATFHVQDYLGMESVSTVYFTVDLTKPWWSNYSVNNTERNTSILFSVYWQDNFALSGFIFSTNNNGSWVNDSFQSFTGTGNWSNVTKTLNSTNGVTVSWRIYANDTANNWNVTNIFSLTTTCTENWTYSDWSACSCPAGTQTRNATDPNSCGTTVNRSLSQGCSCVVAPSGGAAGPEAPRGEATVIAEIAPLIPAIVPVYKEELALTEIKIAVNTRAENVQLTFSALSTAPVSVAPQGSVYKYIEIKVQNLADENVKEAKIKFKVNKSWLTTNNVDEATVKLNRYTTSWQALSTTKLSADATNVYYEASTPGFSYFAISGQQKAAPPVNITPTNITNITKPVCGNGKCESGENETICPQDCKVPTEEMPFIEKVILIAVICALLLIPLFVIKRKPKPFEFPPGPEVRPITD